MEDRKERKRKREKEVKKAASYHNKHSGGEEAPVVLSTDVRCYQEFKECHSTFYNFRRPVFCRRLRITFMIHKVS